ncbi:MAG: Kelch repeat-containing protein, partial [Candidatus Hodarchaeales archaeon]
MKIRIVAFILLIAILYVNIYTTQGNTTDLSYLIDSSNQVTSDWVEMKPTVTPPARYEHWGQTAYDSQSDRIILFSGAYRLAENIFNDTWAYDYNTNTWENLTTPEMKNVARLGSSMAYDSESDRIIVFGGWKWEPYHSVYQNTSVGETWSYDYETNTWTNMTTETSPPFRGACSLSYDEANDRMIMFGGFNSEMYYTDTTIPFYGDTWAYDYNTNTWTNMNPAVSPPPLGNHESAYDSESNKTVIFGGRSYASCVTLDETWAYDYSENTWINMNPEVHPSGRGAQGMIYNSKIDRIVLFGGSICLDVLYDDTWAYDYNTNMWINMNSPSPPSRRLSPTFDYDSESDVSILFGGRTLDSTRDSVYKDDTWAYHYQTNAPSPPRNLQGLLADGEISLSWETPSTEAGSPITNYVLYRGSDADSLAEYATVQGKET